MIEQFKIEHILKQFKDFNINDVLSITISNKKIIDWINEIQSACEVDANMDLQQLKEHYIDVLNLLTRVSMIKTILLAKFNLAEHKYETTRGIKITDLINNSKKMAASIIEKSIDGDEELQNIKEIRTGAILFYEIFNSFEYHLNRTLNAIKILINTEMLVNSKSL